MENERNDRKGQKKVYEGTRYMKHREPSHPCKQQHAGPVGLFGLSEDTGIQQRPYCNPAEDRLRIR